MAEMIEAPALELGAIINRDPEIMGGEPVFMGTRVPIQTFFDYLEAGHSVDRFLDGFPSVTHVQVLSLLNATAGVSSVA
jgi:uncharacterized protein (DUF433 family)